MLRVVTLLIVPLLSAAACSRARDPAPKASAPADAASPPGVTMDTRPPARSADAGTGFDPAWLAAATRATDATDLDATHLGPAVDVWMVRVFGSQNGPPRFFVPTMVIRGQTTLMIPIEDEGFAVDGEMSLAEMPAGAADVLVPLGPADDRDPDGQGDLPHVPTRKPLLYLLRFHIPGANDFVAVVHDHDELRAYYFWEDEGNRAEAWRLVARARLAQGAKVVAR